MLPVVTSLITLRVSAMAAARLPVAAGACGVASANLTAGAAVPRAVLLPSVAGAPIAPDWTVVVALYDAFDAPVAPPQPLQCALSVAGAVDSAGASAIVTLLSQGVFATSFTLVGSTFGAIIAARAPSAAVFNLTATCTWVTGALIPAAAPLAGEVA